MKPADNKVVNGFPQFKNEILSATSVTSPTPATVPKVLRARFDLIRRHLMAIPQQTKFWKDWHAQISADDLFEIFCAGLDDNLLKSLVADQAPTAEHWDHFQSAEGDVRWGVYAKILMRPNGHHYLYIGSAGGFPMFVNGRLKDRGFKSRAQGHYSKYNSIFSNGFSNPG